MWWFKSNKQKKAEEKALEDRVYARVKGEFEKDIQAVARRIRERADVFSKAVDDSESGLNAQVAGLVARVVQFEADSTAKLNAQSALANSAKESAKKAESYAVDAMKSAQSAEVSTAKIAQASEAAFSKFGQLQKENVDWRNGIDEYVNNELKKIEIAAVAAYNANVQEFKVAIDGKVNAAISSLKNDSKADYESIKAQCIYDIRKLVDDCLGKVEDIEKKKNEVLLYFAENFRSISYCVSLSRRQKNLLIEMHVSYKGSYDDFVKAKGKQGNSKNAFDIAGEIALLGEVMKVQEHHDFSAKELLYKFDETFRQAYDAAIAAKK